MFELFPEILCCLTASAVSLPAQNPVAQEPVEELEGAQRQLLVEIVPADAVAATAAPGPVVPAGELPSSLEVVTADSVDIASLAAEESTDLPFDGPVADTREPYGPDVFFRQSKSIPWRFGGATAAIALTGIANWNWGSSRFRFNSEGWFGEDTASLGMDKLGHAWSSYVLTEFFTDGINNPGPPTQSASYTGAVLAMGLMTSIEVLDGFSKDHGFSGEDLVVDTAGALFSVARRSVPGLREKVDFRLLYTPSKSAWRSFRCLPKPHCEDEEGTARSPITDYSGQRYLLAFKLSGFEQLERTPLRFLELHAGYYARGFTREEEERGDPLRRRFFFGAGINVGELLFPGRPRNGVARALKSGLEYLQVPYTAIHSN